MPSARMAKATETEAAPVTMVPTAGEQIVNGVKFLADLVLLPGASQIVEGEVGSGIAYAGGGLVARYFLPGMFGPLGWIAIGLDSYSVSASGKHLWQHGRIPRVVFREADTPAKVVE